MFVPLCISPRVGKMNSIYSLLTHSQLSWRRQERSFREKMHAPEFKNEKENEVEKHGVYRKNFPENKKWSQAIVRVVQNGKCAGLRRFGRLNRTQRLCRLARHRSAILTVFLSFSAAVSWCAPPKPRKTPFWLFSNLFLNLTKVVQKCVSSRLFETCALGQACVGDYRVR